MNTSAASSGEELTLHNVTGAPMYGSQQQVPPHAASPAPQSSFIQHPSMQAASMGAMNPSMVGLNPALAAINQAMSGMNPMMSLPFGMAPGAMSGMGPGPTADTESDGGLNSMFSAMVAYMLEKELDTMKNPWQAETLRHTLNYFSGKVGQPRRRARQEVIQVKKEEPESDSDDCLIVEKEPDPEPIVDLEQDNVLQKSAGTTANAQPARPLTVDAEHVMHVSSTNNVQIMAPVSMTATATVVEPIVVAPMAEVVEPYPTEFQDFGDREPGEIIESPPASPVIMDPRTAHSSPISIASTPHIEVLSPGGGGDKQYDPFAELTSPPKLHVTSTKTKQMRQPQPDPKTGAGQC